MYIQILRHFRTIGICLFFTTICIPASYAADEIKIKNVKKLVEQIEAGKTYSSSPDQLTHKISQAKKELDSHLKSHPDNIEALILSARLGIIEGLVTPIIFSKGKKPHNPNKGFIHQRSEEHTSELQSH